MNFIEATNNIFKIYNINPDEVELCGDISLNDKNFIIYHLLKTFELAKKNSAKGSLTTSSYACAIVLNDDTVHFGINFNDTRCEISSICAERMAFLEAFKFKVENFSEYENFNYKIKYILMSSYEKENIFWQNKITPCADCLSWFNASSNLSADTKICYLRKENNKFFLEAYPLDKFLPLRNLTYTTYKGNDFLINKSKSAKTINIEDEKIINLYKAVLFAYENNNLAKTSEQNVAAGIIANGEIFTGVKVDFSKRWFIEPLMAASYKAIEKYKLDCKIEAVCFIGEEYTITENNKKVKDGIISLKTIGRLNTKFATADTLVITGCKNGLQVYTASDYLPCEHKFIQNYEIK